MTCLAALAAAFSLWQQSSTVGTAPDLSDYRTVATAQQTAVLRAPVTGRPGSAYLGLALRELRGRVVVDGVAPLSPAETAGFLTGDEIVRFSGGRVASTDALARTIAAAEPGQSVAVEVRRKGRTHRLDAVPRMISSPMAPRAPRGADVGAIPDEPPAPTTQPQVGPPRVWRQPVYRLGVVCVEFPDVRHSDAISVDHWAEALFSKGSYAGRPGPTGQTVYGSMNDYYQEVSCGALAIEGKVLQWVTVSQPRSQYGQSAGARSRTPFLTEALDLVTQRDGSDVLDAFDGLLFIYAGERARATRGSLFWPHRSSLTYKGSRRPYFIVPEGGSRMTNISVVAHEFGHMLGLPDLYARPENPGSEGAGVWCVMSQQLGNGRPQHMSAWCKERMGWIKPAVIDPDTPQKLLLGPIEGSSTECYKVLIRSDGSEYLLLENRRKQGFDSGLPGEGLLVWRVVGTKPILEESHGIEGPAGPLTQTASVPYPSSSNDSYTPETTPTSRPLLGPGKSVRIAAIRRIPDGRIAFHIGYDYR